MIRQYLSNTNENATVSIFQKKFGTKQGQERPGMWVATGNGAGCATTRRLQAGASRVSRANGTGRERGRRRGGREIKWRRG